MADETPGECGAVPQDAEQFGTIPQGSEDFGMFPKGADAFRTMRNTAERTEQHTLTVREVARLFEQAGVPRPERSIINWCQPNRHGVARLDAFFDTNERKYFITPQSVNAAVREEQAKTGAGGVASTSQPEREAPHDPERPASRSEDSEEAKSLERKLRDLEITNRAKDYFIDQLKTERAEFQQERQQYVDRLVSTSREIGELRSQLLVLASGSKAGANALPHAVETVIEHEHSAHLGN